MNRETIAANLRERADKLAQILESGKPVEALDIELHSAIGHLGITLETAKAEIQTHYCFEHISDLLRLHPHHIDQFCEELPELIRNASEMINALACASELLTGDRPDDIDYTAVIPRVNWYADGVDEVNAELKAGGEHLGSIALNR